MDFGYDAENISVTRLRIILASRLSEKWNWLRGWEWLKWKWMLVTRLRIKWIVDCGYEAENELHLTRLNRALTVGRRGRALDRAGEWDRRFPALRASGQCVCVCVRERVCVCVCVCVCVRARDFANRQTRDSIWHHVGLQVRVHTNAFPSCQLFARFVHARSLQMFHELCYWEPLFYVFKCHVCAYMRVCVHVSIGKQVRVHVVMCVIVSIVHIFIPLFFHLHIYIYIYNTVFILACAQGKISQHWWDAACARYEWRPSALVFLSLGSVVFRAVLYITICTNLIRSLSYCTVSNAKKEWIWPLRTPPCMPAQRRRYPSGRLCHENQFHARTTGAQRTACEGLSRSSAWFLLCCCLLQLLSTCRDQWRHSVESEKEYLIACLAKPKKVFLTANLKLSRLQKDEADRLRSYNEMMESHEQRMAGLTL